MVDRVSIVTFPSVNLFVGESTTKWLHGYMSHTLPPTKLNYILVGNDPSNKKESKLHPMSSSWNMHSIS